MVIIYNTVWFKHLKIEFITHGRAGKSFYLILKKTIIKGCCFQMDAYFKIFLQ